MRTVKVVDAAEEDLKEIWAYIAEHNPDAADKLIIEIVGKFALILDHPHIGREQHELLVNMRSIVARDYFIFYQTFENGIEVLRVLHSSRDIERIFERFAP